MNERLKKLAVQAGLSKYMTRELCPTVIERFAELIRADEREACAKLCDDQSFVEGKFVAKAIRARGEPNPAFKNYLDDNWAGIV
jgi:hypothetical protein